MREEAHRFRQRSRSLMPRDLPSESADLLKKSLGKISTISVANEIKEYWQQLVQLDWSIVDPQDTRDSPLLQSVCSPIVVWFLFAETYFPKIKLTCNLSGLLDDLARITEDSHLKAAIAFFTLFSSLKASEARSGYHHFSKFFLQKVD